MSGQSERPTWAERGLQGPHPVGGLPLWWAVAWLLCGGWPTPGWAGPPPAFTVWGSAEALHVDLTVPRGAAAPRTRVVDTLLIADVDGVRVERAWLETPHPLVRQTLLHSRRKDNGSTLRVRLTRSLDPAQVGAVRARVVGDQLQVDVPLTGDAARRWRAGEWPRPLVPVRLAAPAAERPGQAEAQRLVATPRAPPTGGTPPSAAPVGEGGVPRPDPDGPRQEPVEQRGGGAGAAAGAGPWRLVWGLVALLLAAAAGWAAWRRRRIDGSGAALAVGQIALAPGQAVVALRVEGQVLLVAVHAGRVELLESWPDAETVAQHEAPVAQRPCP